jgi:uncharacterized protein involved in exopolysaccharide biosynthesis
MPDDTRHQVNLLDFFAFLLRWRRFILISTLSVTIASIVIVLLLPSRFRSIAVVRSQESGGEGIGSLIASKLGSLGGLANLAPSLGKIPEEMYISILESRWMSERVIDHFDLRTVYGMKTAAIEDVVKALVSRADFDLDELSSVLTIRVEDRSPLRAKEITEYYVDQLDLRNQELKSEASRKEKEFIGQRLDEERWRLTSTEDSLYRFQLATGILDIEEQVKATIQAAAALEAQKLIAQTELQMNLRIWGSINSEAQLSQLKISSIDSTLQALIHSHGVKSDDLLLGMEEASQQGMIYLRLYRDIQVEQLLVGYLLQQYEQARIGELRNTPTLMRIEPPMVATKRAWPRRSLMVGIAFFATFIFASALALAFETFIRIARDPNHPQHLHYLDLRRSLKNE